jgi:hypothetical protein
MIIRILEIIHFKNISLTMGYYAGVQNTCTVLTIA